VVATHAFFEAGEFAFAVAFDGGAHGRPRTVANPEYWAAKIERNRKRDADTDRRLVEAGWVVVRVWEHQPPGDVAAHVEAVVRKRTSI
jgi:G:T-mismatch repair DNA endonuclease (very short patch repair protein)